MADKSDDVKIGRALAFLGIVGLFQMIGAPFTLLGISSTSPVARPLAPEIPASSKNSTRR
jgi:hypothetical protein